MGELLSVPRGVKDSYQYLGGLTFYHLMQYYAVNRDDYPFGPNFEVQMVKLSVGLLPNRNLTIMSKFHSGNIFHFLLKKPYQSYHMVSTTKNQQLTKGFHPGSKLICNTFTFCCFQQLITLQTAYPLSRKCLFLPAGLPALYPLNFQIQMLICSRYLSSFLFANRTSPRAISPTFYSS